MHLNPEHHLTKCMQYNEVYVYVSRVCELHICGQRRFRHTDRSQAVRVARRSLALYLCKYIQV